MDYFEQTMYWLLSGSKGALNRVKILSVLSKRPMNLNELSKKVDLNYKTAQHHIALMLENNLIVERGNRYGKIFFHSPQLAEKNDLFKKLYEASILQEGKK